LREEWYKYAENRKELGLGSDFLDYLEEKYEHKKVEKS